MFEMANPGPFRRESRVCAREWLSRQVLCGWQDKGRVSPREWFDTANALSARRHGHSAVSAGLRPSRWPHSRHWMVTIHRDARSGPQIRGETKRRDIPTP